MPVTFTAVQIRTRLTLFLLLSFSAVLAFSQEKPAGPDRKLKASASVSLNTNGIASIPAFSLDKPAIIASASLVKNRFSYDPTLAYGFDLRPWYIDNWLHYKIINRPSFELRGGFNVSSFFTKNESGAEPVLTGERYFAFSMDGTYKFNENTLVSLAYWNDRGQESTSLKGHFMDIIYDQTGIKLGNTLRMAVNVQLFYINYDGNNDGLFVSPKISFYADELPFALFVQATQSIQSNIEPWPGFRWNLGLSYAF
jgi:hypothetical protein